MTRTSFFSLLCSGLLFSTQCSPAQPIAPVKQEDIPETYLQLTANPQLLSAPLKKDLQAQWQVNHTPMMLESLRFSRSFHLHNELTEILETTTKNKFGSSLDPWQQWLWKQDYTPHASYPAFKARLYQAIDPKFGAYFDNDYKATIRLDEVRWGGVQQDGIPPLRSPKMIKATQADYLSPGDVVFGIEVKGEARAYPKRILAWHEMFVDTIQGVPLAGVY